MESAQEMIFRNHRITIVKLLQDWALMFFVLGANLWCNNYLYATLSTKGLQLYHTRSISLSDLELQHD
jgi:hypothetical protein